MPYFVDTPSGLVTVTITGTQPPRNLTPLPQEPCVASRIRNGQTLTPEEITTLLDGRVLGGDDRRAWLPPSERWEHKVIQVPTFKLDRAEAIRNHLSAHGPQGWEVVSDDHARQPCART